MVIQWNIRISACRIEEVWRLMYQHLRHFLHPAFTHNTHYLYYGAYLILHTLQALPIFKLCPCSNNTPMRVGEQP